MGLHANIKQASDIASMMPIESCFRHHGVLLAWSMQPSAMHLPSAVAWAWVHCTCMAIKWARSNECPWSSNVSITAYGKTFMAHLPYWIGAWCTCGGHGHSTTTTTNPLTFGELPHTTWPCNRLAPPNPSRPMLMPHTVHHHPRSLCAHRYFIAMFAVWVVYNLLSPLHWHPLPFAPFAPNSSITEPLMLMVK